MIQGYVLEMHVFLCMLMDIYLYTYTSIYGDISYIVDDGVFLAFYFCFLLRVIALF